MEISDNDLHAVCPRAARRLTGGARWTICATGLLSLMWFLTRVLPKPSRAAYPCQQAAAPLASGFVLWMVGALATISASRKVRELWRRSRVVLACACLLVAATLAIGALATTPEAPAPEGIPAPNQPMGVAKGLYPGRVVWVHDPAATSWEGPGKGHWWESEHTSQPAADRMMSAAMRRLTGGGNDAEAWEALFRNFNRNHGGGNSGYRKGEKIAIKVNLVGCIVGGGNPLVDPKSYDLVRQLDYMNTSPQMIVALLRQLVREAGVRQEDISVGDPLSLFPNQYHEICRREFPNVRYMDHDGGNAEHPRTRVQPSAVPFYWSSRPAGKAQDFVPVPYAEAKYLVNMANLKSHTSGGVTLCAKNHYGSLIRKPPEKGYYDMHESLARMTPGPGHYRTLVDLMGHAHLGGKTLIYFIDGLYPGVHPVESSPRKFSSAPFNGSWASSLFASQDPVAIDSVAFDFLWSEWDNYPRMSGADDYLHEAALAANPPSGTFYDPDHATNTTRLASLGVHEHWNNPRDRQYSRNLGKGRGIELAPAVAVAKQPSPRAAAAPRTVPGSGEPVR
ncbi:MAG: DUF362 domain-containing protein [Acidobacteria bacterium]|nr:DUF362 domain-containing protein [Acidobacteriota bacterium]